VNTWYSGYNASIFVTTDGHVYGCGKGFYANFGIYGGTDVTEFTELLFDFIDCDEKIPSIYIEPDEPETPETPEIPDTPTSSISTINQSIGSTSTKVTVGTSGKEGLTYSLDKEEWQESNEFEISESGTYTVTIKEESTIADEVSFTVDRENYQEGVKLLNKVKTLKAGSTAQLKTEVTKLQQEIETYSTSDLVFSSSNDKVLTVDENGLMTAVSMGNATVTVGLDGTSHEASLNVLVYASDSEMEAANSSDLEINGEIVPTIISLTLPSSIDFVLSANTTNKDEMLIAPKFKITNNSVLDVDIIRNFVKHI
jgi:hypothetical protein